MLFVNTLKPVFRILSFISSSYKSAWYRQTEYNTIAWYNVSNVIT